MENHPPAGPWSDLARPPLRAAALQAALTRGPGASWPELEVLPSTGSTNAELTERARAGAAEGLVLVADDQRAGRGRLGRSWEMPSRSGLAVSVLLRPGDPAGDALGGGPVTPARSGLVDEVGAGLSSDGVGGGLTEGVGTGPADGVGAGPVDRSRWAWLPLLAGVAVVDALTRICGLPAQLKWPNDVLVPADGLVPRADRRAEDAHARGSGNGNGRDHGDGDGEGAARLLKVCGILAEVVGTPTGQAVVLGAGINVSQQRSELPVETAASLLLLGSATTDRDTVLRAYLRALAGRYRDWRRSGGDPRASGIAAAYRRACATLGRQVEVHLPGAEPVTGLAEDVDDDGRLLVVSSEGAVRALAAGDVVHVRPPA